MTLPSFGWSIIDFKKPLLSLTILLVHGELHRAVKMFLQHLGKALKFGGKAVHLFPFSNISNLVLPYRVVTKLLYVHCTKRLNANTLKGSKNYPWLPVQRTSVTNLIFVSSVLVTKVNAYLFLLGFYSFIS